MENYTVARGQLPREILCLMTDERKTAIRQAGLGILDTDEQLAQILSEAEKILSGRLSSRAPSTPPAS